jgi:hypothetical protein
MAGSAIRRSIARSLRHSRSNTTNPLPGNSRWARIDRQLVEDAASLPLVNEGGIDFVSARVHNYQANPYGASSQTNSGANEPGGPPPIASRDLTRAE